MKLRSTVLLACLALTMFVSCKKEGCTDEKATNYDEKAKDDDGTCMYDTIHHHSMLNIPETYEFKDENNNSTVSYSGQTDRLNMLAEMKVYLSSADDGAVLDKQRLLDMFSNSNNAFVSSDLNSSTKQLENKCFVLDVDLFKSYFDSISIISNSDVNGSNGVAGIVNSTTGTKKYLCSANGVEYTQLIEKGLMGAVLYYQMVEVYTREGKIGDNVDNSTAVDAANGKYYTTMEHHWDEAFGYFGVSTNFPTNTDGVVFVGKYADKRDGVLGLNETIMDLFLKGRAAISAKDDEAKNEAASAIRPELEKVFASTAIHYLNAAMETETFGDDALRNHSLSEAVAFYRSLKYYADAKIMSSQITQVDEIIGDNFYTVSQASLEQARDLLSTIYNLDAVKEVL